MNAKTKLKKDRPAADEGKGKPKSPHPKLPPRSVTEPLISHTLKLCAQGEISMEECLATLRWLSRQGVDLGPEGVFVWFFHELPTVGGQGTNYQGD